MSYDPRTIAFLAEVLYPPIQLSSDSVQSIYNTLYDQSEISYQSFQVAQDGIHLSNLAEAPGAVSMATFLEFDRLSTTVVNAYIGPVFGEYLLNLKERLASLDRERGILIMQSNGGVAPIDDSVENAVRAIFSGPAGGVAGAAFYGQVIGQSKIIGFDMGGTSTDISLVEDGVPHITTERFEAGWKIAVPMIDIETLGAGGGSIAIWPATP